MARQNFPLRTSARPDFLELDMEYGERELERMLMGGFEDFLRAMGGLLVFVGSQFRLDVDGKEYFLDLLLYHRRLRSLVAVEWQFASPSQPKDGLASSFQWRDAEYTLIDAWFLGVIENEGKRSSVKGPVCETDG